MEIQFHSFLTWALDGVKGKIYASACLLRTRYPLSGLCCSQNRPEHFEEENSTPEIEHWTL